MKYSDALIGWLKDSGYSHCYFVAGGNIMHLLNSARQVLTCVAVVHEVAAVIAAEYHNATLAASAAGTCTGKAFALVTAGPGLTNTLTGLAGAWLESRELLLLGGQVKVEDLSPSEMRQLGIQEVDGVSLAAPVCKRSICLRQPLPASGFLALVAEGFRGRPGPVFLELPLDVQSAVIPEEWAVGSLVDACSDETLLSLDPQLVSDIAVRIAESKRPVFLLGGGLSNPKAQKLAPSLAALTMPIMTTWNGADRYTSEHINYTGRPNTWGQRSSNIIIQQADLVLAIGSRLGLQQTGFNWREFVPLGEVVQIDIDPLELGKLNPRKSMSIQADADWFLESLLQCELGDHSEWLAFAQNVRAILPISESFNVTPDPYLNPYIFVEDLSRLCEPGNHIVPCSSGGAFTVMMQAFHLKRQQTMITNKGLASMGYGLSGSIGVSLSDPTQRTILVEGDGGFCQNLQELATVAVNFVNLKIFILCNDGYASIRMTQQNYFDGAYLGCDISSGLGFPDWSMIASAYSIPYLHLEKNWFSNQEFLNLWLKHGPAIFFVPVHPEQTYFPKIVSRITSSGSMESNPLHLMYPELPQPISDYVFQFFHLDTRQ